ncbi:MAG: hypothetical protein ACPG7F_06050 [Aggregatilineales bacterium]
MTIPQDILNQTVTGTLDETTVRDMLIAVGQHITRHQAGYIPAICPDSPPEPCIPDTRICCSEKIVYYWLVRNKQLIDLTPEILQKFTADNYHFPEEWLPVIIDKLKRHILDNTNYIYALLGARGAWLSKLLLVAADYHGLPMGREITLQKYHFACLYPVYRDMMLGLLEEKWTLESIHKNLILHTNVIHHNLTRQDEDFIELFGNYLKSSHSRQQLSSHLYHLSGSRFRALVDKYVDSLLGYDPRSQKIILFRYRKMSQKFAVDEQYAGWDLNLWDILQIIPPTYWIKKWGINNAQFYELAISHKSLQRCLHDWSLSALVAGDYNFITTVFNLSPEEKHIRYIRKIETVSDKMPPQQHLDFVKTWLTQVQEREFYYISSLFRDYPYIHVDKTLSQLIINQYQRVIDRRIGVYDTHSGKTLRRYIIPQHEQAFLNILRQYRDTVLVPNFVKSMNKSLMEHEAYFAARTQMYEIFEK